MKKLSKKEKPYICFHGYQRTFKLKMPSDNVNYALKLRFDYKSLQRTCLIDTIYTILIE